eukprot:scaffold85475_cov54-Phaeocystis_antarctica.AAC.1
MPTAHCPLPNAQCPMPNAQCPMPNAQCPMPNAQCPMPATLSDGACNPVGCKPTHPPQPLNACRWPPPPPPSLTWPPLTRRSTTSMAEAALRMPQRARALD